MAPCLRQIVLFISSRWVYTPVLVNDKLWFSKIVTDTQTIGNINKSEVKKQCLSISRMLQFHRSLSPHCKQVLTCLQLTHVVSS